MTRGTMALRSATMPLAALVLALAGPSAAGNPDTDIRKGAVATALGNAAVCEGGPSKGQVCASDADCVNLASPGVGDGTCSGIAGARIVVRGVLTVIADTLLGGSLAADPFLEVNPSAPCTSCEGAPGRSSMTLLLEFTRSGKAYVFAETFPGLTQPDVDSFDVQLPGKSISGWFTSSFESDLAASSGTIPYKIRWGLLPPNAAKAVAAALGEPTHVPIVLQSNEVPVCTDPASCNHCTDPATCNFAVNTQFSRHSAGDDALGSVRRFKVDIGFIDPAP
jgi:hypothetical protein